VIDLHCHIIPSVDDGVATPEQANQCLKELKELGFTEVLPTPHKYHMFYNPSSETIIQEMEKIDRSIIKSFSFEYMYSFDSIKNCDNLHEIYISPTGWKVILLEFLPLMARPRDIENAIYRLNSIGISPLLAHIERYLLSDDFWIELKSKYSLFYQCSLKNMVGRFFDPRKKQIIRLLDNEIIDNLATDLHSIEQIGSIKKGLEIIDRKYPDAKERLFSLNFESF